MSVPRIRVLACALCCTMAFVPAAGATGQLDPQFAGGSGYVLLPLGVGDGDGVFLDVVVDGSGRIAAAGFRSNTDPGGNLDMVVTRLLEDGSPDPGFGTAGTATVAFDLGTSKHDQGAALFEAADGRLVACGVAETHDGVGGAGAMAVVRLLENGSRDTSFDLDGRRAVRLRYPGASVDTPALLADCSAAPAGGILLAGGLYNEALDEASAVLVRLLPDGSLDESFGEGGVVLFDPLSEEAPAAAISALLVQPDGRILAAGFAHAGGLALQYDMFAARLLADGSLDPSFGVGGVRAVAFDEGGDQFDIATHLALDGDGGLYLTGNVSTAASGIDMALVRLRADGSLDPDFATGGRALFGFDRGGALHDRSRELALDGAGRVYLAGSVELAAADVDAAVVRVLPSGVLDTGFASGGVFLSAIPSAHATDNELAAAIVLDHSERVVVAGEATGAAAGTSDALVLRLTSEQLFRDGFEQP